MSLGRRSEIAKRRGDIAQGVTWRNPYGFLFAKSTQSDGGRIRIAIIVLGVLWGMGLIYMSTFIPWIQLKSISIKSEADAQTNQAAVTEVESALRSVGRNTLRNAFLLQTSQIIRRIDPPASYIVTDSRRLELSLTPVAFPFVVSINDALYASRSDGTLIGRLNTHSGTDMGSKTFIELQGAYDSFRDGNNPFREGFLTDIGHIQSTDPSYTSFRIVRDQPQIIVAMHKDGWYSYIDRGQNIDEQLTRVRDFLESTASKNVKWEYLDPRYNGKVFFRPL